MMNRRAFLRGAAAAAVAIAAAPLLATIEAVPPKLWGDGIHDDTAALQWHLDRGGVIDLSDGVYRITRPLVITKSGTMLANLTLLGGPGQGAALEVRNVERCRIDNLSIQSFDCGIVAYNRPSYFNAEPDYLTFSERALTPSITHLGRPWLVEPRHA